MCTVTTNNVSVIWPMTQRSIVHFIYRGLSQYYRMRYHLGSKAQRDISQLSVKSSTSKHQRRCRKRHIFRQRLTPKRQQTCPCVLHSIDYRIGVVPRCMDLDCGRLTKRQCIPSTKREVIVCDAVSERQAIYVQ